MKYTIFYLFVGICNASAQYIRENWTGTKHGD